MDRRANAAPRGRSALKNEDHEGGNHGWDILLREKKSMIGRASTDLLLIHPPAVKPAEPPPGVAVLLASLREKGIAAAAVDANIEAYLYLLDGERLKAAAGPDPPTALRRAIAHAPRSLSLVRRPAALASFGRYKTAVRHLDRALSAFRGSGGGERLTLGDYNHGALSPFAPADLARLAEGASSTLFAGYFRNVLLPRVERLAPRLIGLSVNYRHQVLPAFELAGLLRRRFPGIPVVGGGGMFSSWRSALIRSGLILAPFSRIVCGPGENSLAALAAGEARGERPPDGPACFLEDGTGAAFRPDFDFAPLGDYFSPAPVLPVGASRGCYWRRCLFCPEAAAPTQPYGCMDPAAFPALLRDLSLRYGAVHFHLIDNAVPLPVLEKVAARREDLRGISWHGFVRFERALLDRDLVGGLAASGCRLLQLGLESGSQRVLDRLGKGTRLEEAAAILSNLGKAGIRSYVYIMLGTPGETEEDAEKTLAFLERHAGEIDYLNLAIMNLPRESPLLSDPGAFGIRAAPFPEGDEPLRLYRPFEAADGWGRSAARRFLARRLLARPAIRKIVGRTPPFFTSNHAVFFRGKGAPGAGPA
jgi:hypothetical protein